MLTSALNGGQACPSLEQSKDCNTIECKGDLSYVVTMVLSKTYQNLQKTA